MTEITTTAVRVPPRPTEDWTDEVDEAFAALRAHAPGGAAGNATARPTANILGIYAWHPAFIRGWMPFSNHLRYSTLSDRHREIAILRTTWLGYGEYEWAQHVWMSTASGALTEAEVAALQVGPDASEWSAADAAVVRAIDEMLTGDRLVSDAVWAEIEAQFERQQLIDFVFTVGTYDMHCVAFRNLGLQLEDGMTGFPPEHRPDSGR
ncbi:carboxymuconolactone decarboxylase family protein [Microbacterium mangrovi]|uniref:carboxymuconolactone decarboxylase family protein n=1 Tax=Microbacterium mangrovi TaxID=1348253 RepID=UPI00068C091C|nr:carboxymuconolactone decarboxylase family protein [Microbacterium mangrovi]